MLVLVVHSVTQAKPPTPPCPLPQQPRALICWVRGTEAQRQRRVAALMLTVGDCQVWPTRDDPRPKPICAPRRSLQKSTSA